MRSSTPASPAETSGALLARRDVLADVLHRHGDLVLAVERDVAVSISNSTTPSE
jgi:hypothetical protein